MVELIQGDCLEVLKNLPSNSVDLVVTDPPYKFCNGGPGGAFGADKRSYHAEYSQIGDGFSPEVLDECCRLLKAINIYVWCSKAQVSFLLNYFEQRNCYIDILTWHKTNVTPTCNNTYLSDTEYLVFAREKGVKVWGTYHTKHKYWVTPVNVADKKLYKHPTIKPLPIIENLIINSSIGGGIVLDPFMGSGTTGVACKKLGRDFIGIEIDPEYYEIAKKRIEDTNGNSDTA